MPTSHVTYIIFPEELVSPRFIYLILRSAESYEAGGIS